MTRNAKSIVLADKLPLRVSSDRMRLGITGECQEPRLADAKRVIVGRSYDLLRISNAREHKTEALQVTQLPLPIL